MLILIYQMNWGYDMGVKDFFNRGLSFVDKQLDKLGPGALREMSEDNTNLYKENHQLIVQNNELMNFINEQRVKMEKQDDIISSLEADKKHLGNLTITKEIIAQ